MKRPVYLGGRMSFVSSDQGRVTNELKIVANCIVQAVMVGSFVKLMVG